MLSKFIDIQRECQYLSSLIHDKERNLYILQTNAAFFSDGLHSAVFKVVEDLYHQRAIISAQAIRDYVAINAGGYTKEQLIETVNKASAVDNPISINDHFNY